MQRDQLRWCHQVCKLALGMAQQLEPTFGFRATQFLKDQVLGIGSYGQVCRARCDNLTCAAKVLHQHLFDPKVQHRIAHKRTRIAPIRKFEQEIELLSTVYQFCWWLVVFVFIILNSLTIQMQTIYRPSAVFLFSVGGDKIEIFWTQDLHVN